MGFFSSAGSFVQNIKNTINAITQGNMWSNITIGAGALLTAYITPIVGLLVTCFTLTVADMFYGIGVAKKLKQKITSDKNWHGTLCKLWHEVMLIGMARLVEFTVLGSEGVFVLTGGITVIIALTELWSIIENLNTLYPDGPWKVLKAFLKKKGEDYTGIELELDKDEHSNDTNVVNEPQEDRR